jgi:hypothetical protein
MSEPQHASGVAYSPDISIELALDGERFSIASVGPANMVVRAARRVPAGRGTLRILVDRKPTTHHVYLPDGIDPARRRQAYHLLEATEEAAA